ncbi:hypothetical protein DMA11_16335 [Marinilabiliaceae bacterium JC017]|nr:hypothetical protein DMA11_16335 [Marinilabiliaceae bacterium JC017]
MKTHVKHTEKHTKFSYILFGIFVTLFTFFVVMSFIKQRRLIYTRSAVPSFMSSLSRPVTYPVTESHSIDLRSLLQEVEEPAVVLDAWMTDLNFWNAATNELPANISFDVIEAPVLLENWMLNQGDWAHSLEGAAELAMTEFAEEPLVIEEWMLGEIGWAYEMSYSGEVFESELGMESWMTEVSSWSAVQITVMLKTLTVDYEEAELVVESWMTSTESWPLAKGVSSYDFQSEADYAENEIVMEAWMLNLSDWTSK